MKHKTKASDVADETSLVHTQRFSQTNMRKKTLCFFGSIQSKEFFSIARERNLKGSRRGEFAFLLEDGMQKLD